MKKYSFLSGAFALIFIVFGIVCNFILAYDDFRLIPIHLVLGLAFLTLFIFTGGLHFFKNANTKRSSTFFLSALVYSLLFLGILFVANYYVFKHDFLHYDSTSEKVYSLAPQTEEVLKHLDKTVVVRAFYVGKMDTKSEALLNRYAKDSEFFKWTWVDPEKNPTLMERYGISQSETIHFSFEDEKLEKQTKIVKDISEQEITNALIKLVRPQEKILYYLTGHGEGDFEASHETGFLFLKESIQGENITFRKLSFNEQAIVPDDANAVLVLAPRKKLLDTELDAIKSYLQKGGNALFIAEPRTTDDIANLVRPLGITVGNNVVVDQIVRMFAGPGLGVEPIISTYGIHPITKNFTQETVFKTACSVVAAQNKPSGSELTELAISSSRSWAEHNLELLYSETPTAAIDANDFKGPTAIAAAYTGVYPKGDFLRAGQENKEAENASVQTSRVAVIGDQDFINNSNMRKVYNLDFFLNSLNWVIGQEQGVSIRARNLKKSIKKLTDDQSSTIFIMTGIIFPEILLLLGLSIWWSRKNVK
ncbi:MAG: GldG family protein [Proteobacteria bacterium]|nr:GldG family protein [Pseudomonadota bacterium]